MDFDLQMFAQPGGNKSSMAVSSGFLPAQEDGVFSQVGIDFFWVKVIKNTVMVDFSVFLPGQFLLLIALHQRPSGTKLSILPCIFKPGQMPGIGVGYGNQVQSRLPDPVGEVI